CGLDFAGSTSGELVIFKENGSQLNNGDTIGGVTPGESTTLKFTEDQLDQLPDDAKSGVFTAISVSNGIKCDINVKNNTITFTFSKDFTKGNVTLADQIIGQQFVINFSTEAAPVPEISMDINSDF